MVAALYVQNGGVYFGLPNVDPWDEERDARKYAGPHPVVAHPPCERWGRYWGGGPSAKVKRKKGDDGGCFAAALEAVRTFGGVLEHPADSHAWAVFGLKVPTPGGWSRALLGDPGWVCVVAQSAYGHRARKLTWLYYVGDAPPPLLDWRRPKGVRLEDGFHTTAERRAARAAGLKPVPRLLERERAATPAPFRDLLISIAEGARHE
jgi:hypothetical protein